MEVQATTSELPRYSIHKVIVTVIQIVALGPQQVASLSKQQDVREIIGASATATVRRFSPYKETKSLRTCDVTRPKIMYKYSTKYQNYVQIFLKVPRTFVTVL